MKRLLLILLFASCGLSTASEQIRALVVVDTSYSMRSKRSAVLKTVRAMMVTGFNGQLVAGDRVGFWGFNSQNNTNLVPTVVWHPERAEELARLTTRLLQTVNYENRTRFEPLVADLKQTFPAGEEMLLLIVTDADEPLVGFTYDVEINTALSQHRRKLNRTPAVIAMIFSRGFMRDWRVNPPGAELVLPSLTPAPKPGPAPIEEKAPLHTAEPEPPSANLKAEAKALLPVADLPPGSKLLTEIPQEEPVKPAASKEPNLQVAAVNPVEEPNPLPPQTIATSIPEKSSFPPAPPGETQGGPETASAEVQIEPVILSASSEEPGTESGSSEPSISQSAATEEKKETKSKGVETSSDPVSGQTPAPTMVGSASPAQNPLPWVAGGLACLALLALLTSGKKKKPTASLITRSMDD